jgi:hypothetical protein
VFYSLDQKMRDYKKLEVWKKAHEQFMFIKLLNEIRGMLLNFLKFLRSHPSTRHPKP